MNSEKKDGRESLILQLEGFRENHRVMMAIAAQESPERRGELACSHFRKISGADETALFLLDPKTGRFQFRAAAGRQARRYDGGYLLGDIPASGEGRLKAAPSAILRVQTETGDYSFHDKFIMVIPLSAFSRTCGYFLCEYGGQYAIAEGDESEPIRVFLGQLASLFERFVENRQLEEKARSLELLYEIGSKLSSIRDEDKLLETILALIEKHIRVDRCSLMIMDEERKNLRIRKTFGIPDVDFSKVRIPLGVGIAGHVATGTRPLLIKDLSAEQLLSSRALDKENFRTNSLLSVPLVTQGEVIGVINVNNRKDGLPFTEDDMDLLSKIGSEIAAVLQRSYMAHQLKKARELDGDIKRFTV